MTINVLYFGRWSRSYAGHYLFTSSGDTARNALGGRLPESLWSGPLDGIYPRRPEFRTRDQREKDDEPQDQSAARMSLVDGWTVLAFWDRTADHRGNSNSAFLAPGSHTFDEMRALAREHFPGVMERIEAAKPIYLRGDE